MKFDAILIDGKNSIYRAIFAGYKDPTFDRSQKEYSIIVLRFLYSYLIKFMPQSIHIFWDPPSANIWRKEVIKEYKTRDMSNYEFDVEGEVEKCQDTCRNILDVIGVYQYYKDDAEADDLIYAWCKVNKGQYKSLIISSDGDLLQIPYLFDDVSLYNPLLNGGTFIDRPDIDPVEIKCFQGDKSDTIDGYYQIGPVRSKKLSTNKRKRQKFLENSGFEVYNRNRKVMDLTLAPNVLENCNHISDIMSREPEFNTKEAKKLAYNVKGLMSEYTSIISPFKTIIKNK